MKRFTVPCDFKGKRSPFHVYIGAPKDENHPLQFQADWLAKERGGTIPQEVMDSFAKLHQIAKEQKLDFEELCAYALGAAGKEDEQKKKQQPTQLTTPKK